MARFESHCSSGSFHGDYMNRLDAIADAVTAIPDCASRPVTCVICSGTGEKPHGFYRNGPDLTTCRGCRGTGIVGGDHANSRDVPAIER